MPDEVSRYTALPAESLGVANEGDPVKVDIAPVVELTEKPAEKPVETPVEEPAKKADEPKDKPEGEDAETDEDKPKRKSGHQRDREKIYRLQAELESLKSLVLAPPAAEKPVEELPPNEDDFDDYKKYKEAERKWTLSQIDKIADAKVQKVLEAKAQETTQNEHQKAFSEKLTAVHTAHPDLEDLLEDLSAEGIQTTRPMDTMIRADAEILYQLASKPAEAKRIAALPEHEQYIELGKIREALRAKPNTPITKAAPPIKPVSASASVIPQKGRYSHI